jgi:hypothetical protein
MNPFFEGFSNRVTELSNKMTRKEAYHQAEGEYKKLYGRRKYSSYHSFKTVVSRKHKNRIK